MNIINDCIEKYGVDKILHTLGGGWIEDAVTLFGLLCFGMIGYFVSSFIALPIVYVVSWIKEFKFDKKDGEDPDRKDIEFAMYGASFAFIKNYIVLILYYIFKIWILH